MGYYTPEKDLRRRVPRSRTILKDALRVSKERRKRGRTKKKIRGKLMGMRLYKNEIDTVMKKL